MIAIQPRQKHEFLDELREYSATAELAIQTDPSQNYDSVGYSRPVTVWRKHRYLLNRYRVRLKRLLRSLPHECLSQPFCDEWLFVRFVPDFLSGCSGVATGGIDRLACVRAIQGMKSFVEIERMRDVRCHAQHSASLPDQLAQSIHDQLAGPSLTLDDLLRFACDGTEWKTIFVSVVCGYDKMVIGPGHSRGTVRYKQARSDNQLFDRLTPSWFERNKAFKSRIATHHDLKHLNDYSAKRLSQIYNAECDRIENIARTNVLATCQ